MLGCLMMVGKKLLLSEKKAINIMEEHFAVVIGPISCLNFLRLGILLGYYLVTSPLVMLLWPEKIIKHFKFYCSFCKDEAICNVANIQTFHMFLRLPAVFYKALLLLLSAILFYCVENCVCVFFHPKNRILQ